MIVFVFLCYVSCALERVASSWSSLFIVSVWGTDLGFDLSLLDMWCFGFGHPPLLALSFCSPMSSGMSRYLFDLSF